MNKFQAAMIEAQKANEENKAHLAELSKRKKDEMKRIFNEFEQIKDRRKHTFKKLAAPDDTLDIRQASLYTGYSEGTIRGRAYMGEIPVIKHEGKWYLSKRICEDLKGKKKKLDEFKKRNSNIDKKIYADIHESSVIMNVTESYLRKLICKRKVPSIKIDKSIFMKVEDCQRINRARIINATRNKTTKVPKGFYESLFH